MCKVSQSRPPWRRFFHTNKIMAFSPVIGILHILYYVLRIVFAHQSYMYILERDATAAAFSRACLRAVVLAALLTVNLRGWLCACDEASYGRGGACCIYSSCGAVMSAHIMAGRWSSSTINSSRLATRSKGIPLLRFASICFALLR